MLLKAKTLKGKNRIHEWGNEWLLIRTADTVLFAQRAGPWGLIFPKKGTMEQSRWIHLINDQDFDIISL
jgi:hypothetical protein